MLTKILTERRKSVGDLVSIMLATTVSVVLEATTSAQPFSRETLDD